MNLKLEILIKSFETGFNGVLVCGCEFGRGFVFYLWYEVEGNTSFLWVLFLEFECGLEGVRGFFWF